MHHNRLEELPAGIFDNSAKLKNLLVGCILDLICMEIVVPKNMVIVKTILLFSQII